MPTELTTFERALQLEPEKRHRHLLLGNGFSIACKKDIFTYGTLFERADFRNLSPNIRRAFELLQTTDFEEVMKALGEASELVDLYSPASHALATEMSQDSEALKEVLVRAISQSHPEFPAEISNQSFISCRKFLSNFTSLYTMNYDLLLYWTIMQNELEPSLNFDDGFRTPDTGPADYVTWEVQKANRQDIHYLHGSLHIFQAGHEIQKYTWSNTGVRLVEQIRTALDQKKYLVWPRFR